MRTFGKTQQLLLIAAAVLGIALLGACGGGGGGSAIVPLQQPQVGGPQSIQTSIPFSDVGSAIALPPLAGYNETITLTPNSASAGTRLHLTILTNMPKDIPSMPAGFKETQGFLSLSISSSKTVTLDGFPGFTLTIPRGLTWDGGTLHLGFYDPASGWHEIGGVTLVGRTMTFLPTRSAVTLRAGANYAVAPFACEGPSPSPTSVATTVALAPATPLPIPPLAGFSGDWVAAANNAPAGTTVTLTSYLSAPAGAPTPASDRRHPLTLRPPVNGIHYVSFSYSTAGGSKSIRAGSSSSDITFAKFPAVSMGLPGSFNTSGVTFKLETFDFTTGELLDVETGTSSGPGPLVESFPGTNAPFTAVAGHTYLWELVAVSPTLYVANRNSPTFMTVYDQNGDQLTPSGSFPNLRGASRIAFNSSNGHLYVTSFINNAVTEYDLNGNQITPSGTFPNLNAPFGIAVDPSNGHLYVNNIGPDNAGPFTITVYDENGNQITPSGTFPNINDPFGLTFDSSNGQLYVINIGNNTITVYDRNGNQVTTSGSFPNLSSPNGITFDPLNGRIYVANEGTPEATGPYSITVYDQNGNQITTSGTFPNLSSPVGIAVDSSTAHLYVTNASNNTITEYDQDGNQITPSGSFPNLQGPDSIVSVP